MVALFNIFWRVLIRFCNFCCMNGPIQIHLYYKLYRSEIWQYVILLRYLFLSCFFFYWTPEKGCSSRSGGKNLSLRNPCNWYIIWMLFELKLLFLILFRAMRRLQVNTVKEAYLIRLTDHLFGTAIFTSLGGHWSNSIHHRDLSRRCSLHFL